MYCVISNFKYNKYYSSQWLFIIRKHVSYKFDGKKNAYVSNLVLDIGCMQFDKSPLAANLKEHINNYRDVFSFYVAV